MTNSNSSTPQPGHSPDEEELVSADDSAVGRAFRNSLIALVIVLSAVGLAWFALRPKPKVAPARVTTLSTPVAPSRTVPAVPTVAFSDVTTAAGIQFNHFNGAAGEKLLPETMGSGVAFFDFDNDGHQDLLLINGTDWPWAKTRRATPSTAALYRNDGQGHFSDVTAGSGLDVALQGMGVAAGDFDNDGNVDLFITAVGGNRLFRNLGGGKFADATGTAGVGGPATDWSTCAAWVDYDNDGRLDLLVGNYVRWSREIDFEVGFKIDGAHRAYGQPMNFQGAFPCLFHNEGGGKFTDVSTQAGLQVKNLNTGVPVAKSLGISPIDLNNDGLIDFIIANDTVPNFVFTNAGNGTFKEIGAQAGVAFDSNGQTRGAMGIDVAHFRNDGALGIAIGNFANEMTALYVSQDDPCRFADESIQEGIGPASRLLLKFGLFFFDYDLDSRLDLLSVNGHLEEEITKIQASQSYRQPAQLFWNNGSGFSVVDSDKAGTDLFKPLVGRASAYADMDGDGDLDVVLTQAHGAPLLLRNDQKLGNHFVRLKLVGRKCNRDAIGAWVRAKVGGQLLRRQVMPTRSYLAQSELPVTLGLGAAGKVEELEILWPGGSVQKVTHFKIDGVTVIEQAP